MPTLPNRKPTRLKNHNYAHNDSYFVTLCLHDRHSLLSKLHYDSTIVQANVILTEKGCIVDRYISAITDKYPCVTVDNYCIMPDHIHLLITIHATDRPLGTKPDLSAVIGWFKYQTTKQCNLVANTPGLKLYQRSYFDHIIRNEEDYDIHWEYIESNANRWIEKMQNNNHGKLFVSNDPKKSRL